MRALNEARDLLLEEAAESVPPEAKPPVYEDRGGSSMDALMEMPMPRSARVRGLCPRRGARRSPRRTEHVSTSALQVCVSVRFPTLDGGRAGKRYC